MSNFDQWLNDNLTQEEDDSGQKRKQAGVLAAGRNPDQYAKANTLSDRLNLPVDIVHDNLADYHAQDADAQFDALGRDHPEVNGFLSDPRRRTLVQDDAAGMTGLAKALKFGGYGAFAASPIESGNGDIPLSADARIVGRIYTDKRGMPRRWTADGWQGGDLARNSTLGEKAQGMALALPIGATNVLKSTIDLASLLSGVDTNAEYDTFFRESNAFYESKKPAAYRAEQTPIVQRDSAGGISGLSAPSVEGVADAIITSLPQIPMFLGTGGGLKGMADAVIPNSPKLAAFLGYGAANAALVAPGQRQDTMSQVRSEGGSEAQAQSAGNKAGVLTALLTSITGGAGATLAGLQGQNSRYVVQAMIRGFVADAPLEGVEEGGQSAINDVAQGKRVNSADALEQGLLAAISGGMPGAAIASIEHSARLKEITAAAKAAKIGERSPADAEAFAESVAGDQRVYVKAADAKVLFQSEMLAELVGGSDALSEQMATGDVSIPMSKWVSMVARLPNADEIVRHSRMHPDGLSAVEIEQQDQVEAELFDKPQEDAEPAKPDTRQQVIDDVAAQLIATNRYTPAQAESQAKLFGAAIGQFASKQGADPLALYQRYMAGISDGSKDVRSTRQFMGSAREDAIIDSVRTGSADTKAFGPSLTSWLQKNGGIQDQTGELRSFDAQKLRPGLVNKAGMALDRARELAAEQGFIGEDSTVADFLDLVDKDLRSASIYSDKLGSADRQAFAIERAQLVNAIDGIPRLRDMPRDQFAALTNQQIAEAVYGSPTTLGQQSFTATTKAGEFALTDKELTDGPERSEFGQMRLAEAFSGGKKIGELRYANDGTPPTIEVDAEYRRKGVATALLKLAKQQGGVLGKPDTGVSGSARPGYRTDDGQAFRASADEGSVTLTEQTSPPVAQELSIEPEQKSLAGRAVDAVKTLFQSKPKSQTETKEFKRWFGDSKVVDANAEPLVVYHGSSATFDVFDIGNLNSRNEGPGFYFTTSKRIASGYVNREGNSGQMVQAFLSMQKPLPYAAKPFTAAVLKKLITRIAEIEATAEGSDIRDGFLSNFGDTYSGGVSGAAKDAADLISQDESAVDQISGIVGSGVSAEHVLKAVTEVTGYDGIVSAGFSNEGSAENTIYVAFRPEQIKSATANRGTFDPADPSILNQGSGKGPRGQISIFPDRRMSIELFAGADRTTFLHESAHFWFEMYRDLAASPEATPKAIADFNASLKFMGVASVDELDSRAAQIDAIQEQADGRELTADERQKIEQLNEPLERFARGFEAYAADGKAPSEELRSVFAQFKSWILSVYRNLKSLNVELTPEIRGVFDRMLASDDEIEAAQVRQGMVPLAATASEAKALRLTDKQFAAYIQQVQDATEEAKADVFNKLNKAWERERLDWWKEERAAVRQEIADQYEATPAVRALRILGGAKSVGGVELSPPLAGMKLDKAAIVAEYGDEYLKRLGKTYAKSGGVHPDEAASVLGFTSGDHLLKSLANAPDTLARVESEADAIMRERHGDPMTDGTIAEKAMTAVHGSKRVQLLERELEILAKLAGQPAPERRILNAIAERRVAAKTARQLRPNEYLSAERRAAREAIQAAAKGKYAEALVAKRQQAVNVALYSAAIKAREQFDKNLRYLQRVITTDARARLGKAGADYLGQVDYLLEAVELKKVSGVQVDRRVRLAEWVAKQEAAGNPISVPSKTLSETGLTNIRDMPHEDVQGVVDTIKQIEHLAKTKTKLMLAGVERDREEVDAELAASVLAAHVVLSERTGDETKKEKARQFISDVDIARLLPANIARELDGYEEGGAVWSNVIAPIRKAIYERVIPAMHAMQESVAVIYSSNYTPAEIRQIDQPVWREQVNDTWSKGRILSLAMNWGSEGNREAILSQSRSKITEEQAVSLLRTLEAKDWKFVQEMVEKLNSYWAEVAEAKRRRTGLVPPKVEAQPFSIETASGEVVSVAGGYMRLYYDSDRSGYGSKQKEIESAFDDLRAGRASGAMTRNGATIERVGSGGQTVDLSVDTPVRAMRETIRDLYLGDAVNYVANVLEGHDFKSAIADAGMRDHLSALELWLKDVATGELGPRNGLEAVVKFARQNTTAAMMTYKISSAALQVTGVIQSAVVIGNRAMLQGVVRLMSKTWFGPHSVWNEIRDKSVFMRERFGQIPDAVEVVQQQREGALTSAHSAMLRWGYIPMARVQMVADASTWLAGERVGLKKFNGDVDKARAFADDLVIRAQSPDNFIDKSSISRGTLGENHRQSEYVKSTTMLLSYMIAKGNIAREKYQATSFTSPQQVMRFSADMVQLFALEVIIMGLVRNGLPEDEEDDGIADDWIAYLAKEMVLGPLATIPLLSQLATEGRGYTSQGVMERSWGQVEGATSEWADDELGRADLKALVNVSGIMLGIPSSQINTTADALWRTHDGEDVTPIDYVIRPEKPRN